MESVKKIKHRTLPEECLLAMDFAYHGTIISGRFQEIDIFRAVDIEMENADNAVEIRVTLSLDKQLMIYSSIALTDSKGAPVLITGAKSGPINIELAEVALYEAIEYDERASDYHYGRPPLGEGHRPGTFIKAKIAPAVDLDPA